MSPIQEDGAIEDTAALTGDDSGVDEFLKSFLPPDALKKKPSEGTPESNEEETKPEETTEDAPEKSDESPDEKGEEEESSEEETKEETRKYADDEGTYVKVKVGDKEHEVPVKDLKRLFGQEASLTQKSQQVAQERQQVEAELAKNTAATQALLQRAKARFEPYAKVDFNLAAQQLAPEEYTALRNEAMKAYEKGFEVVVKLLAAPAVFGEMECVTGIAYLEGRVRDVMPSWRMFGRADLRGDQFPSFTA